MLKIRKQQIQQLEALSGISADEAKSQLIDSLKNERNSLLTDKDHLLTRSEKAESDLNVARLEIIALNDEKKALQAEIKSMHDVYDGVLLR